MRPRHLLLLALPLGLAAGFYFARNGSTPVKPRGAPTAPTAPESSEAASPPPAHLPVATAPAKPLPKPVARLLAEIERLAALLQIGPNDAALADLKRALLAAEPGQSIRAILQFLGTGADAPTGQDFTIAERGALDGAPTMRVFLLDLLGQLSRTTRSDDAAKFSRALMETKTSADEWALALRNVAWHEPSAKPYLAGKMREMLGHDSWRATQSAGMLEAFDVIVFTRDTSFVPDLAETQRSGQRELQRAAAMALDRMAEQAPLDVMTYLNTHPTVLADSPMLRADYFAKADLSQIAQRAALEIYLGRPDVGGAEKSKLLSALATPATVVSDQPLTASPAPDDGAARQAAVSTATTDWLAAGRFPELRTPLQRLQQRVGR